MEISNKQSRTSVKAQPLRGGLVCVLVRSAATDRCCQMLWKQSPSVKRCN